MGDDIWRERRPGSEERVGNIGDLEVGRIFEEVGRDRGGVRGGTGD